VPHPDRNKPMPVLRRNAQLECGELIGFLNVVLREGGTYERISIHCTKKRGHTDNPCLFEGSSLIIKRRLS
jgi:hypothetical protein